ncbi:MAG: glycosyltransferase [Aestuariibaculum sp.]
MRAKNLITYIKVVNEIVNTKKNDNFHFVQIGSFTERTTMYLELIEQYGLKNHISFTDFVKNASAFLPQFDFFLLTSQSEGLPQVINEAFYFKVPVISTNAGGITDIVINERTGFLANVNDYKALADKLMLAHQDKSRIEAIVNNANKQLLEGFSTKIMAQKTIELYKLVLNKR